MNAGVRVNAVFAGLVLATCLTWWLGSGTGAGSGGGFELAATLTIVIAFAKIFFIGTDFMELREAPMALKAVFSVWVAGVSTAAVALVVI